MYISNKEKILALEFYAFTLKVLKHSRETFSMVNKITVSISAYISLSTKNPLFVAENRKRYLKPIIKTRPNYFKLQLRCRKYVLNLIRKISRLKSE